MLDKQSFYHGVALIRLLDSDRCQKICRHEFGFKVNDSVFIFFKYRTNSRSPWRFLFSPEEVEKLNQVKKSVKATIVALICGGDGICALDWSDGARLIGDEAGWISVQRKHKEQYAVTGSRDDLGGKVPLKRWPQIVFDSADLK